MSDFSTRRVMMVDTQVRPSDVTKFPIIAAMLAVPRESFVPDALREAAYAGLNITIGDRRVVLEARSLAKLLDMLNIQPGERVLDLGCGLGYASAVIARIGGKVVAVEEDAALATAAGLALAADGGGVAVPQAILDQLAEGGRIGAIFMESALGTARIGYKLHGVINWRSVFNATAPVLPGFEMRRGFVL